MVGQNSGSASSDCCCWGVFTFLKAKTISVEDWRTVAQMSNVTNIDAVLAGLLQVAKLTLRECACIRVSLGRFLSHSKRRSDPSFLYGIYAVLCAVEIQRGVIFWVVPAFFTARFRFGFGSERTAIQPVLKVSPFVPFWCVKS